MDWATVIPYAKGAYYDARPQIALPQSDVLKLNDEVGLHPQMTGMQELFSAGNLAIVEGAGYIKPKPFALSLH